DGSESLLRSFHAPHRPARLHVEQGDLERVAGHDERPVRRDGQLVGEPDLRRDRTEDLAGPDVPDANALVIGREERLAGASEREDVTAEVPPAYRAQPRHGPVR